MHRFTVSETWLAEKLDPYVKEKIACNRKAMNEKYEIWPPFVVLCGAGYLYWCDWNSVI